MKQTMSGKTNCHRITTVNIFFLFNFLYCSVLKWCLIQPPGLHFTTVFFRSEIQLLRADLWLPLFFFSSFMTQYEPLMGYHNEFNIIGLGDMTQLIIAPVHFYDDIVLLQYFSKLLMKSALSWFSFLLYAAYKW